MSKSRIQALAVHVIGGAALILCTGCGSANKDGNSGKKSEGSGSSDEKTHPKVDTKTDAKSAETKHEGS